MSDLIPAVEKMQFSQFRKSYTAVRSSQIPGQIVDLNTTKLQLPNNSTLHTVSHFLNASAHDTIDPDITNPLITHEQWQVFFLSVLNMSGADSTPFPVTDHYSLMLGRAKSQLSQFFSQHKKIHRITSPATVERSKSALLWYDYAALQKVRILGKFAEYRKFDVVFRTVLNHLCQPSGRYQFVEYPLSDRLYSRAQMTPAFSKLDTTTLRIRNDPSYFLLIHLLGMVYGRSTLLTVTPSLSDLDVGQEGGHDAPALRSTSLFNRIDRAISDRIHLILTHGQHAIIYNLGDLQHMAETPGFYTKILRHINTLKLASQGIAPEELHDLSDDEFDQHVDAVVKTQGANQLDVDPDETPSPTPVTIDTIQQVIKDTPTLVTQGTPVKPIIQKPTPTVLTTPTKSGQAILDADRSHLQTSLDAQHLPDSAQHKRADTLYELHLNVTLDGKTLKEHLTNTPEPNLDDSKITALSSTIPDQSMLTSSIIELDRTYIQAQHQKDLAQTLTAFVKHGLFVTDIKQQDDLSIFNRIRSYKVRLIDVEGKAHTVTFDMPHVDKQGTMLINGIRSRMVKQQINLPICKIGPSRVNLSSNYNKYLVEKTQTKAHDFANQIVKYISSLRSTGAIQVRYGRSMTTTTPHPYEYSVLAATYHTLDAGAYHFTFDTEHRFDNYPMPELHTQLMTYEKTYGIFCGTGPDDQFLFWDYGDRIHLVSQTGEHQASSLHIQDLLHTLFKDEAVPTPKVITEWSNLVILSKDFPLVFVLGYQYGLSSIFKHIRLISRFISKDTPLNLSLDEISIPFVDGNLIFSRYPLEKSLIASGLAWMDTSKLSIHDLDHPDAYYQILTDKGISTNYLKGITGFFNFFIDPITFDVLQHMGEPTNTKDLLLKASSMLTTLDHYPSSSLKHHRVRGYERFSSVLYNEMSRQLAAYQNNKQPGKTYSINPQAVFQRITQDETVQMLDVINPIHELKTISQMTFTGSGGRTAQSFVVDDRQYPDDGVGAMSESTPDSGKVGMTVYTSADPKLRNIRGMFDHTLGDATKCAPTEILSIPAMLMPSSTSDD